MTIVLIEKKYIVSVSIVYEQDIVLEENNEPKEQELINELHHGLGHFFNERAVFGNSKNKELL